ncbi:hypothetical protein EUZ85_15340 [Hahella sp. KA22]|uniref:hypothetical protein n=1 Tax=Hahella sp. KA22 TaxID=1628392 RepID=UPI000FDF51C5|nr:hypothetical protein [Hahella sp. KA22]AZZ92032.1 hypothetical protein ENC22_12775 [Hahella sp. KA22]QAY55403.1 hypothetical protein EUZ85_15340 [Hahella sp. KA22]
MAGIISSLALSLAASRRYAIWAALTLALSLSAAAGAQEFSLKVYVAGPERTPIAAKFLEEFKALSPAPWRAEFISDANIHFSTLDNDAVILALGERALQQSLAGAKGQLVVGLFVSRSDYLRLTREYPDATPHTAIFLDAPLQRQARLAGLILPTARTAGVLSAQPLTDLPATLVAGQLLSNYPLSQYESAQRMLSAALDNTDYLLGILDTDVFNGSQIKHILLTAYRHNRFLIGPSLSFVKAGALATTYSTSADFARQTTEIVQRYLTDKKPAPAEHSRYFSVAVNIQVARSLNLIIPDAYELQHRLEMSEAEQ